MQLYDRSRSVEFYDDRYSRGYMEEWTIDKRPRVLEAIRGLDLPDTGDALDFGCGNGIFTEVIRQALPDWNVYGTDISSIAIQNARDRYPSCTFFVYSDPPAIDKQFDCLFSHHVLEHVYNVSDVLDQAVKLLKDTSSMFHILPCGNEGSFEHYICSLRKDGIDRQRENRFFSEDEGHIRRLSTEQVNSIMAKYGFRLATDYYSNHYYGALDWITQTPLRFILRLTNPSSAKDSESARGLRRIRRTLLLLTLLRLPSIVLNRSIKNRKINKSVVATWIFYPFSQALNLFLKHEADREWETKKAQKNGSEMYLYYRR